MSPAGLRAQLEAAGFNLLGELAAADYDARVPRAWKLAEQAPRARGVWIAGHGGRALWPRFSTSPESRLETDPLDRYTRRVLEECAARSPAVLGFALYSEKRADAYLPLVALARLAGLGTPGRVGVLLHPVFGPWISLRAALFSAEPLATPAPLAYAACDACPAPCADACHGRAIGPGGLDAARCYATRSSLASCALRCDARLACPVGAEHAYPPEQIAHHYRIRTRPG
jgi:hypothetical protein